MNFILKLVQAAEKLAKKLGITFATAAALMIVCPKVEAQYLGSTGNAFVSISNNIMTTVTNGLTVTITNNVGGFTNLLLVNTTNATYQLFSLPFTPNTGGSNGLFVGGTNGGIIPTYTGRYIAFDFIGINTNAPVGMVTNYVRFARSSQLYANMTSTNFESPPSILFTWTNGAGAFDYHTNVEEDADSAWQLVSWGLQNANGGAAYTNPMIIWKTAP
jgi:hypothetical protein